MGLETKVWRTGYESNLLTTVPKAVRVQLGLGPEDRLRWNVEGGYARVSKAPAEDGDAASYRLYKQTRGNSLYTALPSAVVEQLRMNERSRVEWELQGTVAHVRKA
jgi:bifunctional DNA-binding transcriptional regulator/antitoxin component of YhaV-PrlF toxin-antitoxin module